MPVQLQGLPSGNVAEVDGTTFQALRITGRPIDYGTLGFYRIAMTSGTMAVSLAANAEVFQFRWPDATRFSVLYRCFFSAGSNVAAATATLASFRMTFARAWTLIGSGGTRANLTGNNQKLRTAMGTSLVNDIGISTTTGLSAGTKTLDAQDMGSIATGIGTGAITTAVALPIIPNVEFMNVDSTADHPFVFAQNEGYVIRSGALMPAGMTWHFTAGCSWAEVAVY
jgi:hypothetical protein